MMSKHRMSLKIDFSGQGETEDRLLQAWQNSPRKHHVMPYLYPLCFSTRFSIGARRVTLVLPRLKQAIQQRAQDPAHIATYESQLVLKKARKLDVGHRRRMRFFLISSMSWQIHS